MDDTDLDSQQTSPNESITTSPQASNISNSSKKKKLIFAVGILLIVVLIIGGILYLGNASLHKQGKATGNQPPSKSPFSRETKSSGAVPEKNILYLGTYQGSKTLFIAEVKPGATSSNPSIGESVGETGTVNKSFDYGKLIDPIKILSEGTEPIYSLNNFKFDDSKKNIFVSLNYLPEGSVYPNLLNKVVQINLDNRSVNELWSNNVGSNMYIGGAGVANINQTSNNKYITIVIGSCYACESTGTVTIIFNTETKKNEFLGSVGDLKFNLTRNIFTYQRLAPIEESCTSGLGCENGKRTVMKPAGDVYEEKLP